MNIDNDTRVKCFFPRSFISTKTATAIRHVLLVNNPDQYIEQRMREERKRIKFSLFNRTTVLIHLREKKKKKKKST
jgi:hypothetical protein